MSKGEVVVWVESFAAQMTPVRYVSLARVGEGHKRKILAAKDDIAQGLAKRTYAGALVTQMPMSFKWRISLSAMLLNEMEWKEHGNGKLNKKMTVGHPYALLPAKVNPFEREKTFLFLPSVFAPWFRSLTYELAWGSTSTITITQPEQCHYQEQVSDILGIHILREEGLEETGDDDGSEAFSFESALPNLDDWRSMCGLAAYTPQPESTKVDEPPQPRKPLESTPAPAAAVATAFPFPVAEVGGKCCGNRCRSFYSCEEPSGN